MYRILRALLVVFALLVTAQHATADTVDHFDYQAGGADFQWDLPIPLSPLALGGQAFDQVFFSVSVDLGTIFFFAADPTFGQPGELQIFDATNTPLVDALGPQFYGGTEQAPTFAPGVFQNLTDNIIGVTDGTLTITEVQVAPVPEPSTALLLTSGMLVFAIALGLKKLST